MNSTLLTSLSTRPLRAGLISLLLLVGSLSAQAQNNWTGTTSSDWNTATNWSGGIPTASSDVVIPLALANQPILSTTAVAKSVEVQSGASLSISNAGILTINGSKTVTFSSDTHPTGFFNGGRVVNGGSLVLGNIASVGQMGLWNVSSFTNSAGGSIIIDQSNNTGLYNLSGSFLNAGTVTIGASATVGDVALRNVSSFTNTAGGSITLNRSSNTGLFNISGGSFVNSGSLTVGALASVGLYALWNQASFTNTAGASISLDNSSNAGLFNQLGSFVNSGSLTVGALASVGQHALRNQASFTNTVGGSITLDRSSTTCLYNPFGSFVNSGSLRVGSVAPAGIYALVNESLFTNIAGGSITLDRSRVTGLYNLSGSFVNSGSLRVGSVELVGLYALWNQASFTNTAGGSITLDGSSDTGLYNPSGSFINSATITIGTSFTGIAIYNKATFNNEVCAVIQAFAPVYNDNGTFINNGFLTVNTLRKLTKTVSVVRVNSPAGIARTYVFEPASFGPPINTVNLTADAVLVDDGTASPALGCSALTNATQLAGKIALVDRGVCNFSQKVYNAQQAGAIAVIVFNNVADPLFVMPVGNFGNLVTIPSIMISQADGAMIKAALTSGPVNISISQNEAFSTALINNGVIEYPQGNPIPNVTNNGVIAAPLQICYQMPYTPALQLGASNTLTVSSNWFTDPTLTQPAGTYTQGTNTFDPSSLNAVNAYPLSFTVGDSANGCVRTVTTSATVSFPVSITAQPAASSVVCEFGAVSVPVGVTGTVLSYQWYKNGSPVVGQTTATLSLPSASPSDTGTYSLVITGGCNSSTSTAFSLSVGAAPVVTLIFGNSATVMGTGIPTITVPVGTTASNFQATGGSGLPGSRYERAIVIDRINGYEIRQTDDNTTGIFPINRLGLFTLTVTGGGGCKRTVQGVVQ